MQTNQPNTSPETPTSILPTPELYKHHTNKNQYAIYLTVCPNFLSIKLTQKYTLIEWNCTLKNQTLVEISKKTGYELPADKFIDILRKALTQRQMHCSIDILTAQDLQLLKSKKSPSQRKLPQRPTSTPTNPSKRYLILSYNPNQHKYHYPLSLTPTPLDPPLQHLKQLYNQLRIDLEAARTAALNDTTQKSQSFSINYTNEKNKSKLSNNPSKIKQIDQAKSENQILKAKLARLEEQVAKKNANIEIQSAIQRTKILKQSIQTCNGELLTWKNSIQQQQQAHTDLKKQLNTLHKKICSLLQTEKQLNIKKKGQQTGKQLHQVKNIIKKNNTELETLKKQLQTSKNKVKQLQIKTKKLNSQKQVIKRGKRGPYSSASSVRSYNSFNSIGRKSTGSNISASSKPRSNYSYSYNKRR